MRPKLDLGVPALVREARAMFRPQHLGADLVAGATVACVALPLSLAIALASGVPPAVGLITAIVGGIVVALFGGAPLAVSGPAAAMTVLVATLVQQHGTGALLIVGVGCGILQLLTGVFRLGRFARLVPLPVIEGFTAGIGAIILIGQLPRALGLPPPPAAHVVDVVTHIVDLLHETKVAALGVTALTLAVIYGLPKVTKKIPSHLAAVFVATLAVAALGLDTATIGAIPRSLPMPSVPTFSRDLPIAAIVGSTFVFYALASLETLLSSVAVDKLAKGHRTDPDQELVGQGLGNLASAFFGGIPITGVIARSATNVQAGAKTRRSAIIHALLLLLAVLVLAPILGQVPIAALAAVLFSVAFRMLSPVAFVKLWRHSRADGAVFAITFASIVFLDLLEGVQWGVVAALVIAAIRLGRTRTLVRGARVGEDYAFSLEGPVTFLSSLDVENLRQELDVLEPNRGVVLDLGGVTVIDASGAEMLASVVEHARSRGLRPVVIGLAADAKEAFLGASHDRSAAEASLAATQLEAVTILGSPRGTSADARLKTGVARYRATMRPRLAALFESLADGQSPHTLFITCADSRVDPTLITATDPGELFIVRDIGNLVPPSEAVKGAGPSAAIEYAVQILGVRKIVVCGHSGCGAIKALLAPDGLPHGMCHVEAWLEATHARALLQGLPKALSTDEIAKLSVLAQVENLRSHAFIADREAAGELSLAAWFFDVKSGELEEWSVRKQRFATIDPGRPASERTPTPALPQDALARYPRPSP